MTLTQNLQRAMNACGACVRRMHTVSDRSTNVTLQMNRNGGKPLQAHKVVARRGATKGGAAAGGMDIGSIIGQVASGGVGGGVVLAIVGVVKNMMAK